jgi:K+-sensing histidine kinase KdpD
MVDYLQRAVAGRGSNDDREFRIVRHNDKNIHWVHGIGRLEFEAAGQPVALRGTWHDITELKQVEAVTIEMEVLKRTSQAKSELLANVSHELRTPLSSIKDNIESLIETDVQWSKEQQAEFLKDANMQADRLTLLIRDLLDMSRIDSGKLTLDVRSYRVDEILESVSGILSIITEKHRW